MEKERKSDIIEMLFIKNVVYIVLGFAIVPILAWFGVDFTVGILGTAVLIMISNYVHCRQNWVAVFDSNN